MAVARHPAVEGPLALAPLGQAVRVRAATGQRASIEQVDMYSAAALTATCPP